jgi:uncharacterized membrane protein YqiK
MMELPEIIAALNAYVGTDKAKAKEVAKSLRADARDVAQHLINVGAGQKAGEVGGKVDELASKVSELTEQLEAKDEEIAKMRSSAPDVAAQVDAERKKGESKAAKERERAEAAETRATALAKQVAKDKIIARLTTPNELGQRADREYAELIAAAKLDDRVVVKADGSIDVLQIGESTAYDGETLDQKIDALVKDFRPSIPASFLLTNADSGAGVRSGGGAGVGLKTLEQIKQEKHTARRRSPGSNWADRLAAA